MFGNLDTVDISLLKDMKDKRISEQRKHNVIEHHPREGHTSRKFFWEYPYLWKIWEDDHFIVKKRQNFIGTRRNTRNLIMDQVWLKGIRGELLSKFGISSTVQCHLTYAETFIEDIFRVTHGCTIWVILLWGILL